ncbi:MAG: hypothetical protein ACSHXF_10990 [Aquaticitalea sp.]
MDYINLEDGVPKVDTTYKVLINTPDGDQRESRGIWKCCEEFELIDDSLEGDEFIVAWKQD